VKPKGGVLLGGPMGPEKRSAHHMHTRYANDPQNTHPRLISRGLLPLGLSRRLDTRFGRLPPSTHAPFAEGFRRGGESGGAGTLRMRCAWGGSPPMYQTQVGFFGS
jgi:hypothetical protein